uniref:RAP domain-containing protein n=1 Tax=Clastoptera arizonana TaxID=38151 RepID=A0A1B6CQU6_9HEMI
MFRYITLRNFTHIFKQAKCQSSLSSTLATKSLSNPSSTVNENTKIELEERNIVKSENKINSLKSNEEQKSKLVSTVFASLNEEEIKTSQDKSKYEFSKIDDLNRLLSKITYKISRSEALKIVSVLADWTNSGHISTSDFEKDRRYLKLCKILGQQSKGAEISVNESTHVPDDLATVLGVAGDDEAAKIIGNITINQMVKVITSLSARKRRSLPILRSLAFNIGKSSEKLNIKQGADILYAAAQLNFYDEVLFEKVCLDLTECIMMNSKRAVIGSISMSLGFLKYKDKELLDLLCEWTMKNINICHTQDFVSLLITLATLNYTPLNQDIFFEKLKGTIIQDGVSNTNIWLDVVWSLVILSQANHEHVASVLSPKFLEKLSTTNQGDLTMGCRLKLLNINGAAKLKIKDYKGPFLDSSDEKWNVSIQRTKDKQTLVTSVIDTLSNLVPSSYYLVTNIDSKMGFYIDGECIVDANLTPLPIIDKKTGKRIERESSRCIKIAILVLDYHDMTRGHTDSCGIANLAQELTRLLGYKVLTVDYTQFNPRDKLVSRVKYLKELLQERVKH